MATQSTFLDENWKLIANAEDDPVLVQAYKGLAQVEYLTTATDSDPDASDIGHRLSGYQQMTRLVIGPGYIWSRLWGRTKPATLIVSGSSVDLSEN